MTDKTVNLNLTNVSLALTNYCKSLDNFISKREVVDLFYGILLGRSLTKQRTVFSDMVKFTVDYETQTIVKQFRSDASTVTFKFIQKRTKDERN